VRADVSDEGDVLSANGAFYAAFAAGNFDAMDTLWAREAPVACVHPGWPPVCGRDQVMSTWAGILQNPPQPAVRPFGEHVMMLGDVGMVIGFEAIGDIALVATNVFAREDGVWRMVHHQAAVTENAPRETGGGATPRRVH
jgi:ketosteroid isomerase-like protein